MGMQSSSLPPSSPHTPARRGVGLAAVSAGGIGGALLGVGGALLCGVPATSSVVDVSFVVGSALGVVGAVGVERRRPGSAGVIAALGVAAFLARLLVVRPTILAALAVSACAALAAGAVARRRPSPATGDRSDRGAVLAGAAIAAITGILYALWSVQRHARFGSGSWDHGCYLHNAWLFAHGDAFSTTARSSVLGDVAFWGGTNHFMPSLVLTAPLAWLMEATQSTSFLLVAQAFVVCGAAVPLSLHARRAGLSTMTAAALAVAFTLHTATQAFLLFDVHEVAPVPLLMFVVFVIVAGGAPTRRRVAGVVALLVVLGGCKESALLYSAATGAWMVVFAPPWRRVGVGVGVAFGAAFFVVTGVVQPALLEPGGRMIHVARFPGFVDGDAHGLGGAVVGVLTHPGRAVAMLVTPDVKLATIGTAVLGFGGLPLVSGEALVLALPNLAERFLSDKREMWGQGFHYGLVGAGVLAIACVDVLRRARARVGAARVGVFDAAAPTFLLVSTFAAMAASPAPPELASFTKPYYASDAAVARYQRALALVRPDDDVVAQNHFLPHVALRRRVWLPERRFVERADVVVLDPAASPWPHDRRHVERLVADLQQDPRFSVALHEETTWVFRRRTPGTG